MLRAEYSRKVLKFKETAITSRSKMNDKETFIIHVTDDDIPGATGTGECALFRGLSAEDTPDYEQQLEYACNNPESLPAISSIRFGFETALLDMRNGGAGRFITNSFTEGTTPIRINGLIWMGDKRVMKQRIREKLDQGFNCIKLKIGGIDFNDEIALLKSIRDDYSPDNLELRVDANGAFSPDTAMQHLERLAEYGLHSIEQPIKQGQWDEMAALCRLSPIPVALDEELVGFKADEEKIRMLETIKPGYIILKPSLCGGFAESDRWIRLAEERGIGWWATSALESNIGLNAIAQWVSQYNPVMPQGLGTGMLYTNNYPSRLRLDGDRMYFNP